MDIFANLGGGLSYSLASAAICLALIASYWRFNNVFSYWEKRGIKSPPTLPIFGNIFQMIYFEALNLELDWVKKYGKVYGIYQCSKPSLVIADPKVLQQVCIKDFDCFTDHEGLEFQNRYQKEFIFGLKGDHWRAVRALISPTFTSGKIRRMFKLLDRCSDELVQCFNERLIACANQKSKSCVINVKDTYNSYTMDAITSCCYGFRLERAGASSKRTASNVFGETRDEFMKMYTKLFELKTIRVLAVLTIPKFILNYFNFEVMPDDSLKPILHRIQKLIETRQNPTRKFDDYLQVLIDSRSGIETEFDDPGAKENDHADSSLNSLLANKAEIVNEVNQRMIGSGKRIKVELSDLEVLSHAVFLIAVGLETTSNLLTSCTYALAFHPEIQEKLYDELLKIVEYSDDNKNRIIFSHDSIASCQYLDSVISETLRCFPPALKTDRRVLKKYRIESRNIDIPEGINCFLALYAIMNDPDSWKEPHKFDPERFMPGNREKIIPGSYCPFGIGPRHCIGMRFSLAEAKLAVAKILMNFRVEPAPGTKFPPESSSPFGLLKLKKPVVRLVQREDRTKL